MQTAYIRQSVKTFLIFICTALMFFSFGNIFVSTNKRHLVNLKLLKTKIVGDRLKIEKYLLIIWNM